METRLTLRAFPCMTPLERALDLVTRPSRSYINTDVSLAPSISASAKLFWAISA